MLAGKEGVLVATHRLNKEPSALNSDLPVEEAIDKLSSPDRGDLVKMPVTACFMSKLRGGIL